MKKINNNHTKSKKEKLSYIKDSSKAKTKLKAVISKDKRNKKIPLDDEHEIR